jgi:hypothetical protein
MFFSRCEGVWAHNFFPGQVAVTEAPGCAVRRIVTNRGTAYCYCGRALLLNTDWAVASVVTWIKPVLLILVEISGAEYVDRQWLNTLGHLTVLGRHHLNGFTRRAKPASIHKQRANHKTILVTYAIHTEEHTHRVATGRIQRLAGSRIKGRRTTGAGRVFCLIAILRTGRQGQYDKAQHQSCCAKWLSGFYY